MTRKQKKRGSGGHRDDMTTVHGCMYSLPPRTGALMVQNLVDLISRLYHAMQAMQNVHLQN